MKTVKLIIIANTLNWDYDEVSSISCSCIMAKALRKRIDNDDLFNLKKDGKISQKELSSIKKIDHGIANISEDLPNIINIAQRYKMRVILR